MAPEIFNNGTEFIVILCPGEINEHERGAVANASFSASSQKPEEALKIFTDPEGLNMPREIAEKLVGQKRTRVRFNTTFNGNPEDGGSRSYSDFRLV